jgi:uncharacterized repeat protein (TIGR01451 family)
VGFGNGALVPFDCTGEAFTVRYSPAELFSIDQSVSPFVFNVIDLNGPLGEEGNVAQLFIPAGIDESPGEIRSVELNNLGFRRTDGLLYAMALKLFVSGNSTVNGNYGIVKIDSNGDIFGPLTTQGDTIPGIGNFAYRFPAGDVTPDGSTMYINSQVTSNAIPANGFKTLYIVDLTTDPVTVTTKLKTWPGTLVNVADWAASPIIKASDGLQPMLYGASGFNGRLYSLDPNSAVITELTDPGFLPPPPTTGNANLNAFGGAWFNAAGRLFLLRNVGEIYEIDLAGPTIISTQFGIPGQTSTYNDAAACVSPQELVPFECTDTALLVQGPAGGSTILSEIDQSVTPFVINDIADTGFDEINAIGYNTLDNFVYGVKIQLDTTAFPWTNEGIVRLDSNGAVSGPVIPEPNAAWPTDIGFNCGDVAPGTNIMYVQLNGGAAANLSNDLYIVDLTSWPAPTFTVNTHTGVDGPNPSDVVLDWAVHPTTGLLYGADRQGGQLAVLDPTGANAVRTDYDLAGLPGNLPGSDGYGAVWFNSVGRFFIYRNSGKIYQVDLGSDPNVPSAANGAQIVSVQSGRATTRNDGAACTGAPVVFPDIDIQKTPDFQAVESGGDAAFTITVTNTGDVADVALTNVTVTDPMVADCNGFIGDLAIGETVAYDCNAINVTEGFTNTACVEGTAGQATVTDCDDAVVGVPAIDILKKPDLQVVAFGGDVTFTIIVTNTGSVDLTDVTVTDLLAPDCNNLIGDLAAGESVVYDCTVTNVTEDFTNTACVEGTTPDQTTVTDCNDADVVVVVVECPAVPAIDIQKTPDLQTVESGANADFTITVTNTGNVDLTDVIVSDPWAPDCNNIIGDLAASDSVTYNCTVTNVTEDFTNIACVAGMADQTTVTSCDDADVVVVAIPGIEILKKPDLQVLESGGGDATFTIIVTNTGNVDLTDVTVTDPLAPDCNNLIGDLAAGESFVYDCTVTNVTEDFTNTATVTGTV